ncbi:MAG: hypothetical protein RLZZ600_1072 [Actinomycetota bacterium]|jgi:DNA helicase-4
MRGAEYFLFAGLGILAIFFILRAIFRRVRSGTGDSASDALVLLRRYTSWSASFLHSANERLAQGRWLDSEFRQSWKSTMPRDPRAEIRARDLRRFLTEGEKERWQQSIALYDTGLENYCRSANETLWNLEMENSKLLFDQVESQPLTREQREAATNFENRVQLVAAAGSGKTSVMVAKAAYAVSRKLVEAERVLMLAFNRDAADELASRTRAGFKKAGLRHGKKLEINTFHAFGLKVIGEATGHKPRLAPWAESQTTMLNKAQMIVAAARKSDPKFAVNWFLLKSVYFRDLGEFGEDSEVEDWDPLTKKRGKRTLGGDIVRSEEERLIANWLYVHDINYVYEGEYKHLVSDSTHGQYQPDFYYPDIDVYHEHFALDESGNPPAHFSDYLRGVKWKRSCHRNHGTELFETTSAEMRGTSEFARLEKMFRAHGLKPELNLNKKPRGFEPVSDAVIINLLLTSLSHFKSNRLALGDLRARVKALAGASGAGRRKIFLEVFASFMSDWQRHLADKNMVDFHDMLVNAADAVAQNQDTARYDLILVDEFQDTSVARLGLVKALSMRKGVQVTVVGDDWQSINRFAGADLSVMTGFDDTFPESETLALTRTFRCDQDICDVSSQMIMQNPQQQRKKVVGQVRGEAPHIKIHYINEVAERGGPVTARRNQIREIIEPIASDPRYSSKSVFILARYNFELEGLSGGDFGPSVKVKTMTIHASKGLEADFVIVVGFNRGTNYGFPSKKSDDPLLSLLMPIPESYPHAEERRLLYVAMTRAKEGVHLLSASNSPSEFAAELRRDFPGVVECVGLDPEVEDFCPRCGSGLVRRTNRADGSEFLGCLSFPRCKYTKSLRHRQL